jgi:IS5 family transposase
LDKVYSGVETRGFSVAMRRGARGHPLSVWGRMRNVRISRKQTPVEQVFAVLKRVFRGGHMLMTKVECVPVQRARSDGVYVSLL